jgi:hypothetical protein
LGFHRAHRFIVFFVLSPSVRAAHQLKQLWGSHVVGFGRDDTVNG